MYKNPEIVKNMFNQIADKYDFLNNVISFGLHKKIKKRAVNKIPVLKNAIALDLCCGTGDISKLLAKRKDVLQVYGLDFSEKMITQAKKKHPHEKITYTIGDCTNLPFKDEYFDLCTISFGLRNIEDTAGCVKEISRVLKVGGYFMHMDFLKSQSFADFFFDKISPLLAGFFYKDTAPYKYLVKSKQNYYTNEELKMLFENNDLKVLGTYTYVFNAINIHVCEKNR